MDVYNQAAKIVGQVRSRVATAKALCLEPQMQKKKQTYAVVCETLRYYNLLKDVLETAEWSKYYPEVDEHLAMVLVYDTVVGRGVKTHQGQAAWAIHDNEDLLKRAYLHVKDKHVIPPSLKDRVGTFPRYGRVNTLKGKTIDDILRIFRKRNRDPEDGDKPAAGDDAAEGDDEGDFCKRDPDIPDVVHFPPNTDLHAHPLVKQGHVVLQDKASSLPAAVLYGAVKVTKFDLEGNQINHNLSPSGEEEVNWAPKVVIDGCAAPGNKTSQLAALGRTTAGEACKVIAVERDDKRVELLRSRMKLLGALEVVEVQHSDFTRLDVDIKNQAEAILLDPSCTSSGVVSRVDVQTRDGEEKEKENPRKAKQIAYVAAQQLQLLTFAMTKGHFPNVRRIVYSTCSVNREEDEDIVSAVLSDPTLKGQWSLSSIMPKTWATRGREFPALKEEEHLKASGTEGGRTVLDDDDEDEVKKEEVVEGVEVAKVELPPMSRCIRCDADTDNTSGFFVACFDRVSFHSDMPDPAEEARKMEEAVKMLQEASKKEEEERLAAEEASKKEAAEAKKAARNAAWGNPYGDGSSSDDE